MVAGGQPRRILRQVRERHPVVLHGVSMSIGSADGLRPDYLRRLRALVDEIQPLYVSDHLCWSRIDGFNSHDLLPLPYTEEALDLVCANIAQAQDALGPRACCSRIRRATCAFAGAMSEWEFMAAHGRAHRLRPAAGREQRLRQRASTTASTRSLSSTACRPSACARSTWPATARARTC